MPNYVEHSFHSAQRIFKHVLHFLHRIFAEQLIIDIKSEHRIKSFNAQNEFRLLKNVHGFFNILQDKTFQTYIKKE